MMPVKPPKLGMSVVLASLAMLSAVGLPPGRPSRHDPERPKTPEDLKRIEAARVRQERKAAKRLRKS